MVESIANIVRAWPAERIRDGQPYLALELICGVAPADGGRLEMEWSINVRCEPRIGRPRWTARSAPPTPTSGSAACTASSPARAPGVLREPGYVMRFRKERSFVYSLIADGEEQASAPLEQIARAQVAVERAVDRPLPADPDPVVLRGARPPPVPPPREQARAPGTLGTARGRAALDVQPRRDARRRAHPEPQPVLARDRRRRRHAARRARRSPPPSSRAAARTAFTAAG